MNHALQLNSTGNLGVSPLQPIDEALNRIFISQQEETRLERTRRIMGVVISSVSDEDLEIYLTEFQYLIDSWLDEFERMAFDGVTLKQLIQE